MYQDLFEFLLVEMLTALDRAALIKRLNDVRKQEGARTLRVDLLIARLAFWGSLLLVFARVRPSLRDRVGVDGGLRFE